MPSPEMFVLPAARRQDGELAKLGHETHRRHLELAILELETLVRRGEVEDDLVECRGGRARRGGVQIGQSRGLGGARARFDA